MWAWYYYTRTMSNFWIMAPHAFYVYICNFSCTHENFAKYVHFGLSHINVLLLVCHQSNFHLWGNMTGWPFPRFHPQYASGHIHFFWRNPLKWKFEHWVDEVHFKQIIEKIQGCVTRMCGAMVQYIMAKHTHLIQLAQNKGERREIDRHQFQNKPKLLWGSIEKLRSKQSMESHIICCLHTYYLYEQYQINMKCIHFYSFRRTLHSFWHHVFEYVWLASKKCGSIVLLQENNGKPLNHDSFFGIYMFMV